MDLTNSKRRRVLFSAAVTAASILPLGKVFGQSPSDTLVFARTAALD
jgi:hypothetical protein